MSKPKKSKGPFPALQAKLRVFLELERDPLAEATRVQRLLITNLRVVLMMARPSVLARIQLHAQALTYASMLSFVPLLAVAFAVLKGFGGMETIAVRLEALVVETLSATPELQVTISSYLGDFLSNVQDAKLNAVSVVLLVASVLLLLNHIEKSFNTIFGVSEGRPIINRLVTYWGVLTFGPVALAASLTLTAALQSADFLAILDTMGASGTVVKLTPHVVTWIGFAVMYLVVPNTRVRVGPAILAAIVAGSAWNLLKLGYAVYATNATTVQNIYGALSTIPVFIVWLFLSWLLVLFGAQLAFAFQHSSNYRQEDQDIQVGQGYKERAACRLVFEVARDLWRQDEPQTPEQLGVQVGVPARVCQQLIEELQQGGILRLTAAGGVVPGRDLKDITVASILSQLRHGDAPGRQPLVARAQLESLLDQLDKDWQNLSAAKSFHDFMIEFDGEETVVTQLEPGRKSKN